jgi:hypothetical protein
LTQDSMSGPEKAEYITKYGLYKAKHGGIPFMNLPKR